MTRRYSSTKSRCACGHKIELVNGHWQHVQPHPEAACSCTTPAPSPHIVQFRPKGEPQPRCGIATTGLSMERREGWMPGEGA